jgi:hypothetical protein
MATSTTENRKRLGASVGPRKLAPPGAVSLASPGNARELESRKLTVIVQDRGCPIGSALSTSRSGR